MSDEQLASLTETAHLVDELCNLTPDPNQPYVGRNAFAHKGGMHVAGVRADARTFEHVDPGVVGNRRELLVSELSGKGTVLARAEEAGHRADLRERDARGRAPQGARAPRLPLRGRGRLLRAASCARRRGAYEPLFRLESFRVITEKREDGRVQTEATIKVWAKGERLVRTAEGNGPVNALDRALRDAIADLYPRLRDIDLVNYKVRIIDEHKGTGAVTRVLIDASDGDETWGTIGVSENIIEASWEALVDSLEYAMQGREPTASTRPGSAPSRPSRLPGERRADPARAAGHRPARGGAGARGAALGPAVAGPDAGALRARVRRLAGRAATRSPCRAGRRRCTSACGRSAGARGDEVVTSPFSFVASANCLLYEDAMPVFCDIDPRTLNIDPQAAAAACGERTAGLLPVHIFGYPGRHGRRSRRSRERAGSGIVEDACEALGAVDADGRAGRRARPPGGLRLLREQAARDGGGRHADQRRRATCSSRRAASATRAAAPTWTGSRTTGSASTTGSPTWPPRSASRSSSALDALLAERARVAGLYRERLGGIEGLVLPCEDAGAERRSWFVFVVQLPEGVDRDARDRPAGRAGHRVQGLPALHPPPAVLPRALRLLAAASSRSPRRSRPDRWRCRSSPRMGESEVDRVASALRGSARAR